MDELLRRLLLGMLLLLPTLGLAQNLIPNGSFESYRTCPRLDNLLEEATPWYNPNRATPDFYHQCFNTGQMDLPPHSGQGLAHLYFDQGWSEYLGVKLTKPLVANECYHFEMYVATSTPNKYLTETLGAYFSEQPITSETTDMFRIGPQVLDRLPRPPSLQWQRVSGVFTARGGEQYVTIGSYIKTPPFLGFYYVFLDDVSLVPVRLDLGRDTTLCGRRNTYRLDATAPGAIDYRWQDGSTQPTFLVTKPGRYSVTVITGCKTLRDSITVDYALAFDLGADTTLCEDQPLTLQVPPSPAATYRWQDGSGQPTFTVRQSGEYSVRATQAGCVTGDTIRVRYIRPPKLELGPDQELCGAQQFTIKPVVAEGTFRWQDEFTGTERTVNRSGVYRASVRNECATVTDSIEIDYGACECVLYAPNSFTPNRDGQNDVFLAYGCGDITITSLTVFDRWGEVIFQTDKSPFQWDGHYQGNLCSAGVYAWTIQYRLHHRGQFRAKQQQGMLTLLR